MGQQDQIQTTKEKNGNGQAMETLTPKEIARRARLRYVCDSEPGIHRKRRGRGFVYYSALGQRLTDARLLDRIRSLAIPPAWTDVWICRFAKGHLQATGRDSRGRKQYRYHDRWQDMTGRAKFSALAAFGHALPQIRRQVATDLNREGLPWEKVAALAVCLLDETAVRVGNREYATDNDSYGLTTLQDRHVQVMESRLVFSFTGKGGLKHRIELDNARLANLVAQCRAIRGKKLLQYESERGHQPLNSHDVNDYLSSFRCEITAKTFRTWHGSRMVAESLFHSEKPSSVSARKKLVSRAIKEAAESLGNTPKICRKSYVHPQVIDLFLEGRFPEVFDGFTPRRGKRITKGEKILLRLLEHETRGTEA